MSRRDDRDRASRSQPQPLRTGQFIIDAEGIDREVITADICRYLGNDALVKPGDAKDPNTGQLTQVYVITAYRNLTNAMIHDLKQASADWQAERQARSSSAAYPTNVVDYRSSNALDQSIARMDATQPRPPAPQVIYTSSPSAVPSLQSQSYPSGQNYSQGYSSQSSSYNQNPQGYSQPQSQQYNSPQTYPPPDRTYIHGANYSVDSSAGRGGSVPQSVPRSQAGPYPSSTTYQAPAPQYYSQSSAPPTTSAYAPHTATDPYYSRAAPSGNYETTPEVYDSRSYQQETPDYQMQDATYNESSPYQESGSYSSQPMGSGRSATVTSSSQSRPQRDRDSRDDRDRHHRRR